MSKPVTFDCSWVGVDKSTDKCVGLSYPDESEPYSINKKFNTPIISGVIGGAITQLIFGETKSINVPIIGSVKPAYGMGFYIAAGAWVAEYLEKHNILWACRFGYRDFVGFELMSPLYAGAASQGLSYIGGNDLGLDAFVIGAPATHIGKFIANEIVNYSDFYHEKHPNGLIPTPRKDNPPLYI